jgi:hypothetical protein
MGAGGATPIDLETKIKEINKESIIDYSNIGLNVSKYSQIKPKNLSQKEKDKMKNSLKMALKSYTSGKSSRQNIISFSVELLLQICKAMNVKFIQIGISILKFLLEVIDGPCNEN